MHASKPCQRKQLASPRLLTKKNEPFRIITVFAIAKALSEGQEEPNLKIGVMEASNFEVEVEVHQ